MTNQQWLAKQVAELPPEEVYDILHYIMYTIGWSYNTSRGGVADWLTQERTNEINETVIPRS